MTDVEYVNERKYLDRCKAVWDAIDNYCCGEIETPKRVVVELKKIKKHINGHIDILKMQHNYNKAEK